MFDGAYLDWNQKRIKTIIDYYGHPFFVGKKILDLGCGHADISGILHRLGADVTAVDARQEHLKIVAKKYGGIKTVKADLDRPWPFFDRTFDLTLDMGLICHLNNFEDHLKAVCASSNLLILETAVLDSDDKEMVLIRPDNKNIYDGSFNGFSSQISPANIERVLKNCGMSFRRMDNTRLNSGPYVYDWKSKCDNSYDFNRRRIWFCVRETQLKQDLTNNQNFLPTTIITPFSPNLLDSKIPITHQHLMTSKSPSPPAGHVVPPASPGPRVPLHLPHIINSPALVTPLIQHAVLENKVPADYKIAILVSGHLRVFEKTHKSLIKNLLHDNRNRVDFFIHTWDTLGVINPKPGSGDEAINSVKTETKLNEINVIYNPQNLFIDKSEVQNDIRIYSSGAHLTVEEKNGFPGNDLANYLSMLFSWKKAFQLMEDYEKTSGFTYDLIIKYRPDIIFPDKLDIIGQRVFHNTICQPNIANYFSNGMNDQFAYGDRQGIKVYCHLYDSIISYLNARVMKPLRPETLIKHHLMANSISVRTVPLKYYLLRANNNVMVPHNAGQILSGDMNLVRHLI